MSVKLCGAFTCQTPDTEQDTFLVNGISLQQIKGPEGIVNYDHSKEASGIIGRAYNIKKIASEKDCETSQELRIWKEKCGGLPIIYGCCELFNDENHAQAKSVAAIVENYVKNNLPLCFGWSVEIEPVSVTNSKIYTLSVLKRVALTHKRVNKACIAEVLEEPKPEEKQYITPMNVKEPAKSEQEDDNMNKSELDEKLVKALDTLTERAYEIQKALEAGYAVGAPGTNVQGAALQRSNLSTKKKAHVVHLPDESTDQTHEESSTVVHVTKETADKLNKSEDKACKVQPVEKGEESSQESVEQKIAANEAVQTKDSTEEAIQKQKTVAANVAQVKSLIKSFLKHSKLASKV